MAQEIEGRVSEGKGLGRDFYTPYPWQGSRAFLKMKKKLILHEIFEEG
jgi:hypothetical protein